MLQLITQGGINSVEGTFTPIQADSICVHGDTPGAVEMARRVRQLLEVQGIVVKSFVG
ncbi:LamB/YcsF family protein [compost metagenome]